MPDFKAFLFGYKKTIFGKNGSRLSREKGFRMITNDGKRVVCFKEIPSNVIEEAIFILKPDFKGAQNEQLKKSKKAILLSEANELICFYDERMKQQQAQREEYWRKQKIKIVGYAVIFAVVCFLISLLG